MGLPHFTNLVSKNFEEGSIVICNTDLLKNFKKDSIYQIQKTKKIHGAIDKIKLVGIPGYYSYWNFKTGGKDLQRDTTLSELLDLEIEIVTSKLEGRKIDHVEDKNFVLFNLILERLKKSWVSDKSKRYQSKGFDGLIGNIVQQDKLFSVEEKDFDEIRKMTLEDVISMYMRSS